MATRLWTPEDLGIEPVYWFRAEDQNPDFHNIITKLVNVNGDMDFFVEDAKPINGFVKTVENGIAYLKTDSSTEYWSASSPTNLKGGVKSINCNKAEALLKKSEVSVCFFGKTTYSYSDHVYQSGGISSSYMMFYVSIRSGSIIACVYPNGTSSGRVNSTFNIDCSNGVIGCADCSYVNEEMNVRGNGSFLGRSAFTSYSHQYPYNSTSFLTDKIGGYWTVNQAFLSEEIVYDRILAQSEYEKIEGYFAWKNNRVDLLSSDHPYKEAPPVVDIPEPEPEGVSFLRIRSDVILDMAVQNRFGDVNIDVGSIPLRMLPLPKDSFTGETVTGHYSVYGNPKYILVPKGQVQMPLSLLFTPNNFKVYSITPCSTTLRFN